MSYSKSAYRTDFDERLRSLRREANRASRLRPPLHDLRDMVFQCAIFQTSAAVESYLKLAIESWFQEIKVLARGDRLPRNVRGYFAARKLSGPFERYVSTRDEIPLAASLAQETTFWPMMMGSATIPPYVDGKDLHAGTAYPSFKNLKRLFQRIGIQNIHGDVAAILQRDVENMIESFQGVRTALAHASPPVITVQDVREKLDDMSELVRAIDRVFYRHVLAHGGSDCWK